MANQQRVHRSAAAPVKQRQHHCSPRRNDSPGPLLLQRAMADPALLSPGEVLTLQRSYGNRAVNQLMGGQVVQRLISKEDFISLAGPVTTGGKAQNSLYKQITTALGKYQKTRGEFKQRKILDQIQELCKKWMKKHSEDKKQAGEKVDKKDLRKAYFIPKLKEDALIESMRPGGGKLGKQVEETKAERSEFTEEVGSELKELPKKAKFKFSVMAAIDREDYLEFAEARLKLTIQNRFKLGNKQKSSDIKEAAATQVIEGKIKKGELSESEKLSAIQKLMNAGGDVGHTWVEFYVYDADDKLLKQHSFGFVPVVDFKQPEVAEPGQVISPDDTYENHPTTQRKDYEITRKKYLKGMKQALKLYNSPPDYKLIGYNCTKFAQDIAQSMGLSFPKDAYMRIPFKGLAWNPNALYRSIAKEKNAKSK